MSSRKSFNSKTTAKKVALTAKELRKVGKSLRAATRPSKLDADARQLAAIERLLDEDFDSLAAAKRELKRNTTQVKKTTKTAIKQIKSLSKVFRDAFVSSAQKTTSKSRQTKSKPVLKQSAPKTSRNLKPVSKQSKPVSKRRGTKQKTRASLVPPASKPTKSQAKKQVKPFTLTSLKPKRGENLVAFFDRLEENEDEIDALKNKDDYWLFTYGKGKSRKAYKNIGLGLRHMRGYELSQAIADGQFDDDPEETEKKLLNSISFTRYEGSALDYVIQNEERIKLRNAERKRIQRTARKLLADSGVSVPSVFGGSIDLVESLTEQLRIEREKNANTVSGVTKTKPVRKSTKAKGKSAGTKKK